MAILTEEKMVEKLNEEKEKWMVKVKEDMAIVIENAVAQAVQAKAVETDLKTKTDLETAVAQIEVKMKEMIGGPGKDEKKYKEGLTAKRGFSNVPHYSGKHEEYDDWKFHMGAFLGEDLQLGSLLRRMELVTTIPDEQEVSKIFEDVETEMKTVVDRIWINHQLYQVLSLNSVVKL